MDSDFEFDFDLLGHMGSTVSELRTLRQTYRWSEAIARIDELPDLLKNDPEVIEIQGLCSQEVGRYADALACWDKLLASGDHSVAMINRPLSMAALGDVSGAFQYASGVVVKLADTGAFTTWLRLMINVKGPGAVIQELTALQQTGRLGNRIGSVIEAVRAKLVSLEDPEELRRLDAANVLNLAGATLAAGYNFKFIYEQFVPVGCNCEFGAVQRQHGVEPLSLFRWTSINAVNLARLLADKLHDYDAPERYSLSGNIEVEYILRESVYATASHTGVKRSDIAPEAFLERLIKRQAFLKRKFLEEAQAGEKVFLHKQDTPLTAQDMDAVEAGLRGLGVKRFLFVSRSDAQHPAGSSQVVSPDRVVGYISDVMPKIQFAEWDKIVASAYDHFNAGAARR